MESYSRGRRGAPAKGVGVERRARVQIPHSPPKPPHLVVIFYFLPQYIGLIGTILLDFYPNLTKSCRIIAE